MRFRLMPTAQTVHRLVHKRSAQLFRVSVSLLAFGIPPACEGVVQPPSLTSPKGFAFTGDWDCSGSFGTSGKAHRSHFRGDMSGDSKWIELVETDVDPKGYVGRYEIGIDADRTKLLFIDINSSGFAVFESPGWDGAVLTVTSTDVVRYGRTFPKNRFVYTVQDTSHFDVSWQIDRSGSWLESDILHCSSSPSPLPQNRPLGTTSKSESTRKETHARI